VCQYYSKSNVGRFLRHSVEIHAVERGICPVAESIMTDTVISVRRGNFGDSAINKGYIVRFSMRMRETVLFLLPVWNLTSSLCAWTPMSYRLRRGNSGDLRTFKAEIVTFMIAWMFRTFLSKMAVLGQNRGRGGAMLTPQRTRSYFWGCYHCASFGRNLSRNATVRVRTYRQTDTRTDRDKLNLLSAPCYML